MPSAKTRKAAIYARTNQDPRTVFECRRMQKQIEQCLSTAESKGISIDDIHIYKDEGLSGTAPSAPDLDRLLSKVADYGYVFVPNLSRISRDAIRAAEVVNHILDSAAALWCCDEQVQITREGSPPTLQLMNRIHAYVREIEREKRSTAAKRAHENRRNSQQASLSPESDYESMQPKGDPNDIQEK
jgi:DNA invertase Pin-like site-specific DNA recombinase